MEVRWGMKRTFASLLSVQLGENDRLSLRLLLLTSVHRRKPVQRIRKAPLPRSSCLIKPQARPQARAPAGYDAYGYDMHFDGEEETEEVDANELDQ